MNKLSENLAALRQQHNLAGDYAMTLELLRALKAGEASIDQVILTGNGWQVLDAPAAEMPPDGLKLAEPAEPAAGEDAE